MPNGCEISDSSLTWAFTDFKPIRFRFMFRLDDEGKCRLNYDQHTWRMAVGAHRRDYRERLVKLLHEKGSPRDWQDAKEFLKL